MRERVVRLEINGLFELFFSPRPGPIVKEPDEPQRSMGLGEGRGELQGSKRRFLLFGNACLPRQRASKSQFEVGLRDAGVSERVARITGDGFLGVVETFPRTFRGQ